MPLKQANLDRQLSTAKKRLADRTKTLSTGGKDAQAHRADPQWRKLRADVRRLEIRMRAAKAVVALDEEVKRRREEKANIVEEPKPKKAAAPKEPKAKKEKKPKAKSEGGDE